MIATVKIHVTELTDGRWVVFGRVFQTPECAKRHITRMVTNPEIIVQQAGAYTDAFWHNRNAS